MTVDSLLGMTFMLFTGAQPNWAEMAQTLLPASKDEIRKEVIEADERLMGSGASVRVLGSPGKTMYRYSNNYEYAQACNKYYGGYRGAISPNMVDEVLPMVNINIAVNEREDSIFWEIDKTACVSLWHPEGIVVNWETGNPDSKIHSGNLLTSKKGIEFMNQFLEEPYIFDIDFHMAIEGHMTIGVMRDNKLILYDRKGNTYDGIEDLIIKKYGSVASYIAERKKPKIIDSKEYDMDGIFVD